MQKAGGTMTTETTNCVTCGALVYVTDVPSKLTGNCWRCEVKRLKAFCDDRSKFERERDVAQARISKAIAALENGQDRAALEELKGEGLCTPYRCASLKACHRLLERWQWRWEAVCRNVHDTASHPADGTLDKDTDAMLVGDAMPAYCPGCQQALAIACPSCGRKHLETP
jgi:hypothetical protein